VAVTELVLQFKDNLAEGDEGEPLEFGYSFTTPEGFEVTGGQIFVEDSTTSDLKRLSFRIDRDEEGAPSFTILENPNQ
jgi:hypothetical protein